MLGTKYILIVALGGAVGSVARYKLGGFVLHHTEPCDFPVSTFAVNVIGCFLIGVLAALAERHEVFSLAQRTFLFTGVLGGFTTFSAFGYESAFLIRRHLLHVAASYVCASVLCALVAVFAGMKLIDVFWPARH